MKNRKGLIGAAKFSAIAFSFVFLGLFFVTYIMPTIAAAPPDSGQIECVTPPMKIIAHKIVCESESDLPNWGAGGPNVSSSTAQDFVNSHPGCRLESGWKFQWAYSEVSNPGDNTGEAGSGWNTFGPTDGDGKAYVEIADLKGTPKIWVREAWKEGYIAFSGGTVGDVSAELYCHEDVEKYDNYDYVLGPQLGKTYYCVAFNVARMKRIPVHTCTGDGELYLYQGYPFQTINTSFAVLDERNEVLIFAWKSEKAKLFAYVDGSPTSMNLLNNPADSYSIYSIPVSPGSTVSIKGWCKPESTELGARCVQGFLAQDSSNPVYDPGTLQMIYDDERSNDMYLLPDTYSYVFFDKYTENGQGQGNDTRKLTVTVNGPGGLILNQTYNQPSPYPTQGAVLGTFTASEEGNHNVKLSTEDSIYWVYDGCPAPYCGDGIINQPGEECDDGNNQNGDGCSADCLLVPECVDADYVFDVGMWVVGKGCYSPPHTQDMASINVPAGGRYNVLGLVERGNPGQCQTNEDFYLEINGEPGPETEDDADPCAISVRLDDLGSFSFLTGSNDVYMKTASQCPPDTHANSVELSRLCLYYIEECGNNIIDPPEQCELPDTSNNKYCPQTQTECSGYKLGTRDAYGNCDCECGCTQDPFTYSCVKGQCGAQCSDNSDCSPSTCCVTYNDTCTGLKLTEYNGNKIKDSTQVSNSTQNTCLGSCLCTNNPVTCNPPSTQTYCVKDVCNAQCDSDDDCNDQNPNTIDTCLANCTCRHEQQFFCGDNIVTPPEQCELPNTNNNNYCSQTTTQCSGFKLGTRDAYGNCNPECGCTQDPFTYSCVQGQCGAQCDSNDDCANKCVGSVRYYNGTCNTCSDCSCSYTTENCDLKDGWYNTSTYRWVSTGQCTEKEQRKKEYRDYSCSPSECIYTATNETWIDTGQTRNKPNGTSCNDGLFCTDPDVCTNGICGGVQRNCNDGLFCTTNDRCDEEHDTCAYDQRDCSDNLFCTVNERCDEAHDTCAYDQRDCSQYNLSKIETCLNNPDSNPFTWDYAQGFTSVCNEECDICTRGNQTITHECSIQLCGAECEQDSDCEPYFSDSICHFGMECSEGCTCEDGRDEFCPVPGTVVDSVCYYGTRSCTDEGCGIMNCTLLKDQTCDPDEGCLGKPCDPVPSITDFWGGYSERMIHFPPGGGYNSSAKIYVPISGNFSIISASMDLEGINAIASSDIVLVTDVSGSMDDNCGPDGVAQPGETPCKINDVKNATSQFIQSVLPLSDGIHIGLASYRTSLLGWVNLTRNETALLQEIGTYNAQGYTCISCGIRKGAEIASQGQGTQKSIILLSDGAANRCIAGPCTPIVAKDEAINESRHAWEQLGVRVYVIAFADNGDLATLQQIANAGNGTLVISNITEIIDKYKEMASIIGDSYPTDPSLDIGNSGAIDWSHAGEFSTSETLSDFVSKLDSVRKDCNCTGCSIQSNVCVIDLYTYSSSLGIIRFYNLNITACCYGGGAACCVPETNGSTELFCGDGACNGEETCSNCPSDCGQCPAQCGNGICDSGETCSSCSADCGGCGGNGGGGGGTCTPNWTCTEWTPCCEDATQKRLCTDLNNCGTLAGKPAEIKSCIFIQALTSGSQGCMPGSQMCDKGSLLECTSENKWVKVSSCGTETSGGSENPESSGPLDQSIAGMFMLGSWPYLLVIIAAFFLFLTRGGMKKINGNGKPTFAAGKKMRKGSKGSK